MSRERLASNLESVRAQVARACADVGRSPDDVTLVAVTKYTTLGAIRGLYELGVRDFGESRPQQLVSRAALLPDDIRWHLIGHLQRNKVAQVLPATAWIHSVDSERLARQISTDAAKAGRAARVLLEVNVAGEASKDGFAAAELREQWPQLSMLPNVEFAGLMTMAPLTEDATQAQPVFGRLRDLRDELRRPEIPLPELSMGMSGDFAAAIAEGATMIRLGSILFEGVDLPEESA